MTMTGSGGPAGGGGVVQTAGPRPDQPTAPPPPPGPGVQPPFVAPPNDGAKQRRWTAVGVSIAAALLLCVSGVAGFGGLVYFGFQSVREQSHGVVVDYLSALRDREYAQAYGLLCEPLQAQISAAEFDRVNRAAPRISWFDVGEPSLTSPEIEVPATIRYANREVRNVRFILDQDESTGGFEVCGEAD